MTKAAAAAHKGRGLMGVARDNLPRDGQTYGFMSAFAEVEVDVETGVWTIVDFVGVADVGTVIHPNSLGGQINGGSLQGIGHIRSQKLVYDPHYGAGLSTRMHHNKPPTILDVPTNAKWAAVGLPDPTNPTGAKGIGSRQPWRPPARCWRRWPTRSATTSSGAPRCSRNTLPRRWPTGASR